MYESWRLFRDRSGGQSNNFKMSRLSHVESSSYANFNLGHLESIEEKNKEIQMGILNFIQTPNSGKKELIQHLSKTWYEGDIRVQLRILVRSGFLTQ